MKKSLPTFVALQKKNRIAKEKTRVSQKAMLEIAWLFLFKKLHRDFKKWVNFTLLY